jgi:hypothetical protein
MNNFDKIFYANVASWIQGRKTNISFKGNKRTISVLNEVLNDSKELYKALNNDTSTLDEIILRAEVKKSSAQNFKRVTGKDWPF